MTTFYLTNENIDTRLFISATTTGTTDDTSTRMNDLLLGRQFSSLRNFTLFLFPQDFQRVREFTSVILEIVAKEENRDAEIVFNTFYSLEKYGNRHIFEYRCTNKT